MNQDSAKSKWTDFTLLKSNRAGQSTALRDKFNKNCQSVRPFEEEPQQINFSCQNCQENLQKVTSLKKSLIVIEYQNAKLIQQIQKITKQNTNLKAKLAQRIQIKINQSQNGRLISVKQDLQAQLFECRILNQLLMVGQYTKLEDQIKSKVDQVLMEKMILQEQLQQKNRIISNTVLYPIYHYDQRIRNLRNAVVYFYKVATRQCKKTQELLKKMKKQNQNIITRIKSQVQIAINERFKLFNEQRVYQSPKHFNQVKQNIKSFISIERRAHEQNNLKFKDKEKALKKTIQKQKQSKQQSKSRIKLENRGKKNKEKLVQQRIKQKEFTRPCCIKPLQ